MKKFLSLLLVLILLVSVFMTFAQAEDIDDEPIAEEPVVVPQHRVTIQWILDTTMTESQPPFSGTLIGSYSFDAAEGDVIDMSSYKDNPAGASYWQPGFINYNGIPCYLCFTYADGGRGIDANGNPVDNLPFSFDPFGDLVMPGTDVNIYYLYAPYYEVPDVPEDSLDKIVIYVNRPTGDINPIKQEYRAYEILHVGKAPTVEEDVTNDLTVGQEIMPDDIGFGYWITTSDSWFDVVAGMTDYFILTETSTEGYYVVSLNPNMPSNEDTAKAIARYLEEHIPEGAVPKIITADKPSYDNDPGYYLIISDINSNLILGTTNIAITEKAEYPRIEKEVDDPNSQIGKEVTFTVTSHFPQGSKAEATFSDVMTDGLTFVDGSLTCNVDYASLDVGHAADGNIVNGFTMIISGDVIRALAAGEGGGDVTFSYRAIVNERALIGLTTPNTNSVRLDFSHWSQQDTADVFVTSFTLLKYDTTDTSKTPLAGARFQLLNAQKEIINLIVIDNYKEYRIAVSTDDQSKVVSEFMTNDSMILIKGLDADDMYYLREVQAPSGYNMISEDLIVYPLADNSTVVQVPNGAGVLLPSTGGVGITAFYMIGGFLILSGLVMLVVEKRIEKQFKK